MSVFFRITIKKAILLTLFLFSFSSTVYSQPVPETCDQNYWDVLRARTYAQGKREMEQAQRIILKPDSVLEYSCFHEDFLTLGLAGASFSERGLSTGIPPPEFNGTNPPYRIYPNSLENALDITVHDSLVAFLDSFSHIYGGGTFSWIPVGALCNPMNVVWAVLKCNNFNPNWWVRFEDLSSTDLRFYPIPCPDPTRTANIDAALAAAYPLPADPATAGGMDMWYGYSAELTGACSGAGNGPLLTGLQFERNDSTIIDDAVCLQPGCHYDGANCVN